MALNRRQKQFCEEYAAESNGTKVYARIYGVSAEIASRNAHKLLQKPEIQCYIQELLQERSQRVQITGDRVLLELGRIGFSDILQAVELDENGEVRVKNLKEIPQDLRVCISEITATRTLKASRITLKLHSKTAALESLMKFLGLFSEFNQALNCLRKYGLQLSRDENGAWEVQDLSRSDT